MKAILFNLIFAMSTLLVCGQELDKTEEKSVLYLFRKGEYNGALSNFSVYVDDAKVCEISNNRFIRIPLSPGKHIIKCHIGSIQLLQKVTEIDIETVSGQDNYVSCDIKQSFTRVRLELTEVVKNSYLKIQDQLELDRCQLKIDNSK